MDSGDSSWDFSGIDKSGEIDSGEFDDEDSSWDFSGMERSGEIDSGDSAWDYSGEADEEYSGW